MKKWWLRQFDSDLQMRLFTYPVIVLLAISFVLEVLSILEIDTVIFPLW